MAETTMRQFSNSYEEEKYIRSCIWNKMIRDNENINCVPTYSHLKFVDEEKRPYLSAPIYSLEEFKEWWAEEVRVSCSDEVLISYFRVYCEEWFEIGEAGWASIVMRGYKISQY